MLQKLGIALRDIKVHSPYSQEKIKAILEEVLANYSSIKWFIQSAISFAHHPPPDLSQEEKHALRHIIIWQGSTHFPLNAYMDYRGNADALRALDEEPKEATKLSWFKYALSQNRNKAI
jgi:hypothetical protein